MAYLFKTIIKESTGLYKEKGSRFLSFAYPVKDETEIRHILNNLRKRYHDARHHCFAWRIGDDQIHYRENDDGEPSNSAGKPILGQILAHDLTDILIVVVRYFGGTLLGVGGLIKAYRSSAADAIKNNVIVERRIWESFMVHFDYSQMNNIMTIIKDHHLEQLEQDFALRCSIKIKVWKKDCQLAISKFKILEGVSIVKLTS